MADSGAIFMHFEGDPKPYKDSQHNIRVALKKLGVTLSHDEFAVRNLIEGPRGQLKRYLDEHSVTRLWLTIDEEFKFRPGIDFFFAVIQDLARQNAFHPVRDYLDGLTWDGVPRIGKWLITYGGAADNRYTSAVGEIILKAAVRRIRRPGCKFDEMLLLITEEQGKNKSTALRILASDEFFSDSLPLDADDKLVIEQTAGRWIVEASELKGMKEVEHLKAMLSRQVDRARLAYARLVTEAPRHFVVIGTSNKAHPLSDPTGNRRFWPVDVGGFNVDDLRRDRDQLWAEASHCEASGDSIRLPEELWPEAAKHQEAHRAADPWHESLAAILGEPDEPERLVGKILPADVWSLIGVATERRSQQLNLRLGAAMKDLGFERGQARFDGRSQKAYLRGTKEQREVRILVGNNNGKRAWQDNEDADDLPF